MPDSVSPVDFNDISQWLINSNLPTEVIALAKAYMEDLDVYHNAMMAVLHETSGTKARRFEKHMQHEIDLSKMEIESLLRLCEKENLPANEREKIMM